MRNHLCGLALAAVAWGAPAAASDHHFYVGIDAGAWFVPDIHSKGPDFDSGPIIPPPLLAPAAIEAAATSTRERVTGNFKTGTDIDVLVGYDFGRIRAEAELSRKHAKFDSVTVRNSFFGSILDGNHDTRGSINALTAVVNVLYDLPVSSTVNLYAGPGIGYGRLKLTPRVDLFDNGTYGDELHTTKRSGAFGQIVAGVRMRVSDRVDVGVKYRFVRSQKLTYDAGVLGDLKGRLTTHSVLLSLGYNFGGARSAAPAPVAEPVEAAPAAPVAEPAAPPPPAPATSGERG